MGAVPCFGDFWGDSWDGVEALRQWGKVAAALVLVGQGGQIDPTDVYDCR